MESTTRPDVSSDPYLNYTAAGRRRLAEARAPIAMLRNADLEEALKAAVLAAFGDGNDANKDAAPIADGTEDPLHVAVWSAEPDPLFKELYPELLPSAGVSEEFGTTHRHNARGVWVGGEWCDDLCPRQDLFWLLTHIHIYRPRDATAQRTYYTQVAIITTSKANADAIIAALQATPPPPADGAGPGRPEGGGKKRRGRGRRRGQVVEGYTPEGESGGVGQGGEVAPGVVEGYQAGTSKWGGSQKPDVEVRAQEAHGRMEEGVKAEVKGKKVRDGEGFAGWLGVVRRHEVVGYVCLML